MFQAFENINVHYTLAKYINLKKTQLVELCFMALYLHLRQGREAMVSVLIHCMNKLEDYCISLDVSLCFSCHIHMCHVHFRILMKPPND